MINIGVIGCGYWGPQLIRNLVKTPGCKVAMIADKRIDRLEEVRYLNPQMKITTSARDIIESDEIDGVVIATPVSTHFELARTCLMNGKHVLVEKPLTNRSEDARELIRVAEAANRTLMVDHTFIYSGAVRKLREMIDAGDLGDIYYYDSVRLNLGLFQQDVNVLWDLAPHDFSLLTHLIDKKPRHVSAMGSAPVHWQGWTQESIAYVAVELEDDTLAHFHLNWLSPVKLRRTLIGGSRRMVIYDHLDTDNQIKIFDKGIELREDRDLYKVRVQYRTGDLVVPRVDQTEALESVCRHFVHCITTGEQPITDGRAGLRVVELLESAEESIHASRASLKETLPELAVREEMKQWELQRLSA